MVEVLVRSDILLELKNGENMVTLLLTDIIAFVCLAVLCGSVAATAILMLSNKKVNNTTSNDII
jgi:hypothetical protein